MDIIIKKKLTVAIVEGSLFSDGGFQGLKAAVMFFKDVFFVIPFRSTDMGGYDTKYNGDEIFEKATVMYNAQDYAGLYDYLIETIPEEFTFHIATLKVFRIKVGWGPFGAFQFKKGSDKGLKNNMNIPKKKDRQELKDFYNI
ncbi:MAG: hypothetical protein C0592_09285 [Marinilabiliales bacterium]|nr:MAG: hypothetical protein C0592_09285 [Marinilabiliales bacterium]